MTAKDEDEREDEAKTAKAKAADRDEDEDEDEASDEDEDEASDEDEDEASDEDEDEDEAAAGSDGDDDAERDASTRGVAKALGVDSDDEAAETDGEGAGEATPQNRAARRRAEAEKRRQERIAKRHKADGDDDAVAARETLPKDKNARAKELLKRRQEAAEGKGNIGLSAGEVVQDQLARAASGTGRWFQKNFKVIVGVGGVAIAATIGGLYWLDHQDEVIGKASDDLAKGLLAERGMILKEDKRTDEQKKDPTPVFTSAAAKADAEIDAFGKVVADRPDSGAGIVARLAQAGAYLDKGDADKALAACDDVLASKLAKADIDVKARALETKGFALEMKKDLDGAMAVFKDLEGVDKTFEDLGRYHQARVVLAKGDKNGAKDIFTALDKKLEVPTLEGPQEPALRAQIEEYLRELDPGHAPSKRGLGGPKSSPSLEELMNMQKQLENMKKQQQGEGPGEGDMPPPPPAPMPAPAPGGPDGTH